MALADGTAPGVAGPRAPWSRGGGSAEGEGGIGAVSWTVRGSVETLLEAEVELDIEATLIAR